MASHWRKLAAALLATAGLASCAPRDAATPAVAAVAAAPASAQRPNILLIISDDVGLDMSTGMYPGLIGELQAIYGPQGRNHPGWQRIAGHPASTPNLDRFAAQGMRFTQAWANPFCSPTRASLLTGLNASQINVVTYADALDPRYDSFVRDLHGAGYATAVFGKWHMAGLPTPGDAPDYPGMKPRQAGFDQFHGNMHAALPTFWQWTEQVQDSATAPGEWREQQPVPRSLPGVAPTLNADVVKVAETIDWLHQRAARPGQPWFGWLAMNLSHATANQDPSAMMIPEEDLLDAPTRAEIRACGGEFGSRNTGNCSGEAQFRAMTNAMDTMLGHLLAEVDRMPGETYVIFLGDNGTPMYGRPKLDFIDNMYITRTGRGKGSAFQGGALVPLVVRGPGIAAGSVSGEMTHVTDLFPTILQLARLPVPRMVADGSGSGQVPLFGRSLFPVLTGTAQHVRDPFRDYVVTEATNLMTNNSREVGVRNGRFKIVCTNSTAACQLFDLVADPLEEYPLARPATCPASPPVPGRDAASNYCYLHAVAATRTILRGL